MSNPEANRIHSKFNSFNSLLSVWHKLLIYYLVEKNKIIKSIVDIDYVNAEDIKEIKTWSDGKIENSLNSISEHSNDSGNCPWCNNYTCKECKYGERHGCCKHFRGDYGKILDAAGATGLIKPASGISTLPDVKDLSIDVHITFTILSKLNF